MGRVLAAVSILLVLFTVNIRHIDVGLQQPRARAALASLSEAVAMAPDNAFFREEIPAALAATALGRQNRVAPPGWDLRAGSVDVRKGGPSDDYVALLEDGATLVTSVFTVKPSTSRLSALVRFHVRGEGENALKVTVLSGRDFQTETVVTTKNCGCDTPWSRLWIDVAPWSGQNIRLKFERLEGSNGIIGLANVATDQLEAHLGRGGRKSAKVADPIDTTSGNFNVNYTDVLLNPSGNPLGFTRYYNSNSTHQGDLGYNWTHTYSTRLEPQQDGSVVVHYPDGQTAFFERATGFPPALVGTSTQAISHSGPPPTPPQAETTSWQHTNSATPSLAVVAIFSSSEQCFTSWAFFVKYEGTEMAELAQAGGNLRVFYLLSPGTATTAQVSVRYLKACGHMTVVAETFSATDGNPPAFEVGTGPYYEASVLILESSIDDLIVDFFAAQASWLEFHEDQTEVAYVAGGLSTKLSSSTKSGSNPESFMAWIASGGTWYHAALAITGQTVSGQPINFSSPPGNNDSLVRNGNGTYTLTLKNQTKFNFSSTGRLTSAVTASNITTTVSYNGSGKITSVTTTGGASLTFSYNGAGRISSISDSAGRSVAFTYNGSADLVQATDVGGGITTYAYSNHRMTSSVDPGGKTTFQNTYDSAGRVVRQVDAAGGVTCLYFASSSNGTSCPSISPNPGTGKTAVVNPRGFKTTYTFDEGFRTTEVKNHLNHVSSFAYDDNDNTVCVTDPLGRKASYSYDAKGNVVQLIDTNNTNSSCQLKSGGVKWSFTYTSANQLDLATDPLGRRTDYVYNGSGHLTEIRQQDSGGSNKARTCFTVNSNARPIEVIASTTLSNCTGNLAKLEYDAHGRLTATVDPRFSGQQTPPKSTLTYDAAGRTTQVKDELNTTSTFTYNARGHVLTSKDHLNNTATFTYNWRGDVLSTTDPLNNVTTYTYDDLYRLVSVTDAANGTTTYAYDANGNVTSVTNARGKATTYVYDALDRITSVTDPLNRTTSYQYNAGGLVNQRTDARGLVTKYFYDALNRLTRIEYWTGQTMNSTVTYAYDALGNRTQMVDLTGTTTYAYDVLNRVTSVTFPGNKVVSYQYDNVGNRTRITYPDGKHVNYSYDAASNLASATDWLDKTTSYLYGTNGAIAQTVLPSEAGVSTSFAYDGAMRLTDIVHNKTSPVMLVTSHAIRGGFTFNPPEAMQEAFDVSSEPVVSTTGISVAGYSAPQSSAGQTGAKTATHSGPYASHSATHILALQPAPSSVISNIGSTSKDLNGNALSLALDKPTGVAQGDVMVASVAIRPSSASITAPSGWSLVRKVDNTSGATSSVAVYVKVAGASEPASYTWTFSTSSGSAGGIQAFSGVDTSNPVQADAGTQQSNTYSHPTPSISVWPGATPISAFAYTLNAAGNRTQLVDSTGTTTYGYDALHRLTSASYPGGPNDTYTYDAVGNRLSKNSITYAYDDADQMTSAGGVTYTYDANGNQTGRGSDTFTWDHENRLAASTIGGVTTTYAYNGDGLRMSKTTSGEATSCVWDVARSIPMCVQETVGSTIKSFVYGKSLISTTDGSGHQTYRLTDAIGSTTELLESNGEVVVVYRYDAFGVIRSQSFTHDNSWLFAGEQTDPESSYQYLRARYFDPSLGRFISRDPLRGRYQRPLTMNPYVYALNRPVNLTDPLGLEASPCMGEMTFGGGLECFIEGGGGGGGAVSISLSAIRKAAATLLGALAALFRIFASVDVPLWDDYWNPESPPFPGWEWRGTGPPGSSEGSWYNPATGESLHPDLNHDGPLGPHWDYKDENGNEWRLFPDGTVEPK